MKCDEDSIISLIYSRLRGQFWNVFDTGDAHGSHDLRVKMRVFVIALILPISELAVNADDAGSRTRRVSHQNGDVSLLTGRVHPASFNGKELFETAQRLLHIVILFVDVQSF